MPLSRAAKKLAFAGITSLTLILLGMPHSARRAEATGLTGAQSYGVGQTIRTLQNRPGRLVLSNVVWDSVRVEVRVGGFQECDRNPLLKIKSLVRGRAWAVATDQTVCWRRELSPNQPTGGWTEWARRTIAPTQQIRVVL